MRQRLLKPARERYRDRGGEHAPARRPRPEAPPAPELLPDPEAERVREAGGPLDVASYVCGCGYLFCAPVSTTVACPHCRADQAW
jgi:hypothetical protein